MSMEAFLIINLIYMIGAIPISLVIFLVARFRFGIKEWFLSDMGMILLPGSLYWMVLCFLHVPKTLGNLLEPIILAVISVSSFTFRIYITRKTEKGNVKELSYYCFGFVMCATVILYLVTPALPE